MTTIKDSAGRPKKEKKKLNKELLQFALLLDHAKNSKKNSK